jgi:23S rRNA-/tRNA-specific pseudouridylate synthase
MVPIVWSNSLAAVALKPAGLPTQAPSQHPSLETVLKTQFHGVSQYVAFPHRLDRPVAGLILVAFTKRAARLLGEQFEARRVAKTYLAFVEDTVEEDEATWVDYLLKVEDEARVIVIPPDAIDSHPTAKRAELNMKVIERHALGTLVELRPTTGRMHQLRVQAATRGHVILGDKQYGSEQSLTGLDPDAIALQASELEFYDPTNGRKVNVKAPLPAWMPRA